MYPLSLSCKLIDVAVAPILDMMSSKVQACHLIIPSMSASIGALHGLMHAGKLLSGCHIVGLGLCRW